MTAIFEIYLINVIEKDNPSKQGFAYVTRNADNINDILISDLVGPCGEVWQKAYDDLNADLFVIQRRVFGRDFTCEVYTDIMELLQHWDKDEKSHVVIQTERCPADDPRRFSHTFCLLHQVDPPKGDLVHVSDIVKNGETKKVRKYSHCNMFNVLDCVTGAAVDVVPEDLAEYHLY